MVQVLVVDDEKSVRVLLREFLTEDRHEVLTAADASDALRFLAGQSFDVVVSDIVLPRVSGVELLERIHELSPDTQVVMITGDPNVETASEVVRLGAFDYIPKPVSKEKLQAVVGKAARLKSLLDETRRLEEENENYREHLKELVKKKTLRLAKSEARYKDLVEKADIAIVADDRDGKLVYFNRKFAQLFGYSMKEMKKLSHRELVHPDDIKMVREFHRTRLQGEKVQARYEFRGKRKDGSVIHIETAVSEILEEGDQFVGSRSYFWDVTERKLTEAKVEESEQKYRDLVEKGKDGIYILQDRRFIYVNDAFCRMFGYSREALEELDDFLTLTAPESREFITARDEKLKKGGDVLSNYEFIGRTKTGKRLHLEASITPIIYNGKKARQGLLRDVTEKRKHEDQFINVVTNTSHLINTPLTVALGYMDMIILGHLEMTPKLMKKIHEKLMIVRKLIVGELSGNLILLKERTSDGWTPVTEDDGPKL